MASLSGPSAARMGAAQDGPERRRYEPKRASEGPRQCGGCAAAAGDLRRDHRARCRGHRDGRRGGMMRRFTWHLTPRRALVVLAVALYATLALTLAALV